MACALSTAASNSACTLFAAAPSLAAAALLGPAAEVLDQRGPAGAHGARGVDHPEARLPLVHKGHGGDRRAQDAAEVPVDAQHGRAARGVEEADGQGRRHAGDAQVAVEIGDRSAELAQHRALGHRRRGKVDGDE
eukprot:CAMPEP_0206010578 /NCGR_PEP_ID=MMETSP1464-20131121/11909_1 /ASSEMBLY_ACC=CAM_ASM_001124 /TAXON_ID=119497 /ORGANISM="Exanthemachrysis gayraliae, Strain RCC1523" /LENGTH=134 /DNA_ID=CAMNT_0053384205 /DNA_START=94 /DNA_END=497 /DNA_ORIENTATION=-